MIPKAARFYNNIASLRPSGEGLSDEEVQKIVEGTGISLVDDNANLIRKIHKHLHRTDNRFHRMNIIWQIYSQMTINPPPPQAPVRDEEEDAILPVNPDERDKIEEKVRNFLKT